MGQQLSDSELLLWSLARNPNLTNTMGVIVLLDGRPDVDRLRASLTRVVAGVDRFRQRVVEPALSDGTFARPEWVVDEHFDFDHHFRVTRPGAGGTVSEAELRRTAARFINDPFDQTRPLWQFLLVSGLAKGRSALVAKVHHSISDGAGLVRMAALLLDFEADAPAAEPIDLDAAFRADLGRQDNTDNTDGSDNTDNPDNPDGSDNRGGSERSGNGLDAGRLLGWLVNPVKLVEAGTELVASARSMSRQLPKASSSPLWTGRSRNRRLEFCVLDLASLKATATAHGGTVNDLFVATAATAAVEYHRQLGVELSSVSATVVINTADVSPDAPAGEGGDNAFWPAAVDIPGVDASFADRIEAVGRQVKEHRASLAERSDGLGLINAIGGRLPSSMTSSIAVDQASKVDFATSNLMGTPVDTWLAGCLVSRTYPVGPVAGTAFNVTLMSAVSEAVLGIHVDPVAVAEPERLQRCISQAFTQLGVTRR